MFKGKKQKMDAKEKYKSVSKDVIADGTVSTRDGTRKVLSVKAKRKDEQESESISETISHFSKC